MADDESETVSRNHDHHLNMPPWPFQGALTFEHDCDSQARQNRTGLGVKL